MLRGQDSEDCKTSFQAKRYMDKTWRDVGKGFDGPFLLYRFPGMLTDFLELFKVSKVGLLIWAKPEAISRDVKGSTSFP